MKGCLNNLKNDKWTEKRFKATIVFKSLMSKDLSSTEQVK